MFKSAAILAVYVIVRALTDKYCNIVGTQHSSIAKNVLTLPSDSEQRRGRIFAESCGSLQRDSPDMLGTLIEIAGLRFDGVLLKAKVTEAGLRLSLQSTPCEMEEPRRESTYWDAPSVLKLLNALKLSAMLVFRSPGYGAIAALNSVVADYPDMKRRIIVLSNDVTFLRQLRWQEASLATGFVSSINDSEAHRIDNLVWSTYWDLISEAYGKRLVPAIAGSSAVSIESELISLSLVRRWQDRGFQVIAFGVKTRLQQLHFVHDLEVAVISACECVRNM